MTYCNACGVGLVAVTLARAAYGGGDIGNGGHVDHLSPCNKFGSLIVQISLAVIKYLNCLLVWCAGKALGYRSGGHALKPCHRTYTLCIAG